MRLPSEFALRGDHIATDLVPGAHVVFTTRRGGVSEGPYASLNLGRKTDDDPRAVAHNRAQIEAQLRVRLRYTRQVHGSRVLRVSGPADEGWPPDGSPPEADGQATAEPGLAATVLVADCLPVAVAADGAVAMLHAGWRGLASGVLEEGVRALRELGGTEPLRAAIGPGAGPCCYEVGPEVHEVFSRQFPQARNGANLDLKAIASAQLEGAGVQTVRDVGVCTICSEADLFYSHRRDRGVTGRQAGIVWLS
jgi:YfiH family protein